MPSRYASMMEHARAVIIGGGVGGTSIAYHLAERGWRDIVLVERAELTSGSTFHSAGLVGQLRGSVTLTKMMMYGSDLYRRLNDETGTDPSWHEVGSIRLASSTERMHELERQAGWAKTFGLPMELIDAQEAQDRFPLMSIDGVLGGVWLPTDGWLDPSGLAQALAAGARQRGATIRTQTRVVGIGVERGRVTRRDRRARGRALRHRDRGRRQRGRHVRARDRADGRRDRPDHPDGAPVPVHRAARGRDPGPAAAARPGQPRATSARRSAGCAWAATSAIRRRGRSTACRPTSTASCSPPTCRASSRSWRARSGACRRWRRRGSAA